MEVASEGGHSQNLTAGSFDDFGLTPELRMGLRDLGYKAPTRVQREVFGVVTSGSDTVVQSHTGSGKTTAFSLPVLVGIRPEEKAVQGVVLCPTRELAVQVATEASRIAHHAGIRIATIYGGASMRAQIDALEAGAQLVVGTPGRVKDLLRRGHLRFGKVRFAVLDEADEMLSMGFWDDVTSLLDQMPKGRQTLLFSATLPPEIERAARQYLREPVRVNLSGDQLNVTTIRHLYHTGRDDIPKPRNFLYVLEFHRPRNAIVFCNRRDETDLLTAYLRRFGFRAAALNGDMPQSARERVLARVKAGELDLMVATDVAARGIDISDLAFVFNYDLPDFDEVYVHRVGRTGRIGKRGTAVSLVRGKYTTHLSTLERQFGVPFEERPLPPDEEILWMQAERLAAQLTEDADGVEVEQYRPVAQSMLERGDVKEILAFLLRTYFTQSARPAESSPARAAEPREARGRRERRPRREAREEVASDTSVAQDLPAAEHDPAAASAGETGDAEMGGERRGRQSSGRSEGERAPARERRGPEEDTSVANLYVSLGRDDGLADFHGLVSLMSAMSGVDIGHFTGAGDLRGHSSHVEVDAEVADQVIAGVHGKLRPSAAQGPALAAEASEAPSAAEGPAPASPADEALAAPVGDEAEGERKIMPPEIVCDRARPRRAPSRGGHRGPRRGPRRA